MKIYQDVNTDLEEQAKTEPNKGYIEMDSTLIAWGCCGLQTTFSAKSLDHARYVYDQLSTTVPLCLALSAGTPFIRGKVQNKDTIREPIMVFSDDRSPSERDPQSP